MDHAAKTRRNISQSLLRPLATGLLALMPIALTVIVIVWLANFIASVIGPGSVFGGLAKRVGWNIGHSESGAYLGGVLFAVLLIYLLGLMLEYVIKERGERIFGGVLSRIPLIGSVYETARKVVRMVEPRQGADIDP